MTTESKRALGAWAEWALVILTVLGGVLHVEHRLTKLEAHLADQDKQLDRIEQELNGRRPHRAP